MKSYLNLVNRYLSVHQKKTRLTLISIAISVTLITGIFSMLEAFLKFEKLQVIHDYGNYHILIVNAAPEVREAISNRLDVKNAGRWKDLGSGSINNHPCALGAVESNIAPNFNISVIEGNYPAAPNEIMMEEWALERLDPELSVGDTVEISLPEQAPGKFLISGIYNDLGNMKAKGVPGVLTSMRLAEQVAPDLKELYVIEFKDRVNIKQAEIEIKNTFQISGDRIGHNERLLAVIGQSDHKAAVGFYTIGGVLFFIVLVAGVVMIYNTLNISVMERVRQFGLLRCIGASQSQIAKLVKREGLYVTLAAIPLGIGAGLLMTLVCSAILKFFNPSLFGLMPLFTFSLSGITAGIVIGFLTVFMASMLPARKAARVSPLNAVTGSNEIIISKVRKKGFLTKILPVDMAMGVGNAVVKKKTLVLMSCSIALSIIMFFGFQVFVDFMHTSMKTTKPYTPDITLMSKQGIQQDVSQSVSALQGVKKVYGRMFSYVDATFQAERLTDEYIDMVGGIEIQDNGLFIPPEKSWLISYDQNQLKWAKADLISGVLDEKKLNQGNGIIAVAINLRKNVTSRTADLQLGDKVYVQTPTGTKKLTVMAILRSAPFSDDNLNMATFITTEQLFTEITGESAFKVIDVQLKNKANEQAVKELKNIAGNNLEFFDSRQKNAEINQAFLTMAVFIYGFVAVIALISILNIINTMNTSVAAKTRYLGVMRAIGMSGSQLNKMVVIEAITYTLTGYIVGCVLGVILQRMLITQYLSTFKVIWHFPLVEIIWILILALTITAFSVIRPLRRVKAKGISDVINTL